MELQFDAKTYRNIANFIESELEMLMANSDVLSLPVIGDLQYFSRPSYEARVLDDQLSLLQERISEAIGILNTLAVIAETKEFIVHPLLKEQMDAVVKPYIDYYNKYSKQQTVNTEGKETKQNKNSGQYERDKKHKQK